MAHNVVHIPLPNGRVRTFTYKRPTVVQGLRKEYKNSDPVRLADIVATPIKKRGDWRIGDMLNLRSVEALWIAYKRAEEAHA